MGPVGIERLRRPARIEDTRTAKTKAVLVCRRLVEVGRAVVFTSENLLNVRNTRDDPLTLPAEGPTGAGRVTRGAARRARRSTRVVDVLIGADHPGPEVEGIER